MSKSSELDKTIKLYLLECLAENGEGEPLETFAKRIEYVEQRFYTEYHWRVKQVGRQAAMLDWLQGLAINIAFYNHDILELAIKWGSLPSISTSEKKKDKILLALF